MLHSNSVSSGDGNQNINIRLNQCFVNRGHINPVPDSVNTYSADYQLQGSNVSHSRANTQLSECCDVSQVFIPEVYHAIILQVFIPEVLSHDIVFTETAKCIDRVLPYNIQTSDVVMNLNTVVVDEVTCVQEVSTYTDICKPEVVSVLSEPVYVDFRYMPDYPKPEMLYVSPLSVKAEFSICNDIHYHIHSCKATSISVKVEKHSAVVTMASSEEPVSMPSSTGYGRYKNIYVPRDIFYTCPQTADMVTAKSTCKPIWLSESKNRHVPWDPGIAGVIC